jgi:hypothetical protein
MVYEYAMWRKRSEGSRLLRRLMRKFLQVDQLANSSVWGEPFDGSEDRPLDKGESLARGQILEGTMSLTRATLVVESICDDTPWYTRVEFLEALAALVKLYPQEAKRSVPGHNKSISKVLWCAGASARMEWYFNNIRMRHRFRGIA